ANRLRARRRSLSAGAVTADRAQPPRARRRRSRRSARPHEPRLRPADRLGRAPRSVLDLSLLPGTRPGRPARRALPAAPPRAPGLKKTLALFAGAALALQTATAAQQPNFSTRREAVRVDVLVTDRGQPIAGLGPADFDLLDNGVAQHVDLVSYE